MADFKMHPPLNPKMIINRSTEGNSRSGKGKMSSNAEGMRSTPSESVGADSLKGWVKKNVGHIEVTEGRL